MGAAQDLDALDVVEVEHRGNRPRDVQVIGVDRDGRLLDRVGFTDATNPVGLRAVGDRLAAEGQVRHLPGEVADAFDLLVFEGFFVERGNRQRGLLQVFAVVFGGDGDDGEGTILGVFFGVSRQAEYCQRHGQRQTV
ncbi:hypothetical protein D3C87_1691440 [compost metagenome]